VNEGGSIDERSLTLKRLHRGPGGASSLGTLDDMLRSSGRENPSQWGPSVAGEPGMRGGLVNRGL
jgi:hypothetical protein